MELDEINPVAVIFAVIAGLATIAMFKFGGVNELLPIVWTIATPIVTIIVSYFIFAKMFDS